MYNETNNSQEEINLLYGKLMTGREILKNIALDFEQPMGYLVVIVGILLILVLAAVLTQKHGRIMRKMRKGKRWIYLLLAVYVVVLLETAFFSREPGSRNSVDLTLFQTWGTTPVEHAYFIENIIMYIPFGVLMPMGYEKMQKGWCCVLLGGASSVCLELMQLFTQRGYCQLDDVVTNTAGTFAGWIIWKTGKILWARWNSRRCRSHRG